MKEVHLQVKSDHLQRMSRVRSPIDAVAELIWNALDADASEVKVDIGTNVMGGIQNITVKDNGHGIDYVEAEPAFENLGGSWKKDVYHSKTRRRLHGKAGQGRFRAFSLGNRVTWRTRYKKPAGKIYEYTIEGNASDLGTFRISDERASRITHTGTEVRVTDVARNSPSLLANSAQQELTEQFALYLRQYPDIQIWYQDRLTNPADVERSVSDYLLEFVKGSDGKPVDAVLTIIEWNTDMERNLYLCDAFGFALETTRAGIHAPGFHFTAYLKSDFFSELADAEQLLPEFNAHVIRRKDQPSRPKAIICCRLSSLNTLLMPPEATLPHSDVNVPGDYFSLAGFEVTTYGRFWVTPEVEHIKPKDLYPEAVFVWTNYLYACGPCNGPKNSRFAVFAFATGDLTEVGRKTRDPV